MPSAASAPPPAETIGGAAGTISAQYARADHTHPRITRSYTFAVGANGSLTGTWQTALPGTKAPQMIYTATYASTGRVTCQNVPSGISVSGFSATCFLDSQLTLTTANITAGVKIGPAYAPAGTLVDVTAIPPSQ